ncbi:MAG: hypothetical protein J6W09_09380, partial [Bacteroidales bacterium]|nr:hypothetical protein [Bacteroidales bacterium]
MKSCFQATKVDNIFIFKKFSQKKFGGSKKCSTFAVPFRREFIEKTERKVQASTEYSVSLYNNKTSVYSLIKENVTDQARFIENIQ